MSAGKLVPPSPSTTRERGEPAKSTTLSPLLEIRLQSDVKQLKMCHRGDALHRTTFFHQREPLDKVASNKQNSINNCETAD